MNFEFDGFPKFYFCRKYRIKTLPYETYIQIYNFLFNKK